MTDPMPAHASMERIRDRFARSEFHTGWLGLRLEHLAPGAADVSLAIEPKHRNLMGTLHGGMISTLADTATGVAMASGLDADETWTTTSLHVTFLAPGRDGRITALGRVVRRGRRFGYAEADVVDDVGGLLARANATFAIMPDRSAGPPTADQ